MHTDESAERCPASKPTARVEGAEQIALMVYNDLLCDEKGRPTEGAFTFSKLLLTSSDSEKYPHNRCGESDGVSLERDAVTRKDEILQKSHQLAAESKNKKAQISKGFAIANVECLRRIRFDSNYQIKRNKVTETVHALEQLVFILADGGLNNPYHCVLRLNKKIDRTLHKKVVERLRVAFVPFSDWGCS
jgi:hypothetical protein